jgi:hypothetical protein
MARYREARALRAAGGSWGVVARLVGVSAASAVAALDRFERHQPAGQVGTVAQILAGATDLPAGHGPGAGTRSGRGAGTAGAGGGTSGARSSGSSPAGGGPSGSGGTGQGPAPQPSPSSSGTDPLTSTVDTVVGLIPTPTPVPSLSVPVPVPSVSLPGLSLP